MSQAPCTHPADTLSWRIDEGHEAACNEAGWRCGRCNAHLGFRPDLDRAEVVAKVYCLLMALHLGGVVYISNGTEGEIITENVCGACEEEDAYDQLSIVQRILLDPNVTGEDRFGHAAYWRTKAHEWLERQAGRARAGR